MRTFLHPVRDTCATPENFLHADQWNRRRQIQTAFMSSNACPPAPAQWQIIGNQFGQAILQVSRRTSHPNWELDLQMVLAPPRKEPPRNGRALSPKTYSSIAA